MSAFTGSVPIKTRSIPTGDATLLIAAADMVGAYFVAIMHEDPLVTVFYASTDVEPPTVDDAENGMTDMGKRTYFEFPTGTPKADIWVRHEAGAPRNVKFQIGYA